MKLHRHFHVAMAILALSAAAGEVYFRWLVNVGVGETVPLSRPLAHIPLLLGEWNGRDETIPPDLLMAIGAQDTLKRTYRRSRHGKEEEIHLYIAYFGGIRGTAPHHPDVCMPGAGFQNVSNEIVDVQVPGFGAEPLRVHRDVFEHVSGERRLVVWFEYIHGRNVASRTLQRVLWVLPSFLGGKRGSVLQVQMAVAYEGNMEESMGRITECMNELAPGIREVLPREDASGRENAVSPFDRLTAPSGIEGPSSDPSTGSGP
jgi:EpsI family protein